MSCNEILEKKKGVRYISIPLSKLPNGGRTDGSVPNPQWEKVFAVGQAVIVSSADHPDAEVRFTDGKRGKIIEPFVQDGVIGYHVTVMGCGYNENPAGGTGFFLAEDQLTGIRALDQRINLSIATDAELEQLKPVLLRHTKAFGTEVPDFDRSIREIKEKRPFKFGWKGICGLTNKEGESYGPEAKKEKIYYFTERTMQWLENECTPGDGADKTKAFKKWMAQDESRKDLSWNMNLADWHALPDDTRTFYYDAVARAMDAQAAALKVKKAQQAKAAEEARAKREADRAAGTGRAKRAAAAAADDANMSKRRRA